LRIRVVKWLCIAAPFVAFALWRLVVGYDLPLRLVVCAGAAVMAFQAFRAAGYSRATVFLAVAFLSDPVIPFFSSVAKVSVPTAILAAGAFAVSLTALKSQQLLAVLSITDRNSGGESLRGV